jgi:hypothetical protein
MWSLPEQLSTHWVIVASLAFLLKQLIADFLLQTQWMAFGKERETDWIAPLAAHCAIHAVGTAIIFGIYAPHLMWLAAVDFVIHSSIDRGKGWITRTFGLTYKHSFFWWVLGADQFLHHVTHFFLALALISFRTLHDQL